MANNIKIGDRIETFWLVQTKPARGGRAPGLQPLDEWRRQHSRNAPPKIVIVRGGVRLLTNLGRVIDDDPDVITSLRQPVATEVHLEEVTVTDTDTNDVECFLFLAIPIAWVRR